jgi:hypothetical protein
MREKDEGDSDQHGRVGSRLGPGVERKVRPPNN